MHRSAVVIDLDDQLDILGQQPRLKIYTQICCCFQVADPSLDSVIIGTLKNGLERLSASFPWLAGKVVNEGSSHIHSGVFVPSANIPDMAVKDFRHDPSFPTMDTFKEANFPFSMLDENTIVPC